MAPSRNTDRSKYISTALALLISLLGFAASWGATKAEAANTSREVQKLESSVKVQMEKVHTMEINDAVERQILLDIKLSLDKIQKDIEFLKSKVAK